jgi:hypothetical protein
MDSKSTKAASRIAVISLAIIIIVIVVVSGYLVYGSLARPNSAIVIDITWRAYQSLQCLKANSTYIIIGQVVGINDTLYGQIPYTDYIVRSQPDNQGKCGSWR